LKAKALSSANPVPAHLLEPLTKVLADLTNRKRATLSAFAGLQCITGKTKRIGFHRYL
jgi:hypothetical protein